MTDSSTLPWFLRPAVPDERERLEALQRRASLNNPGDREALLAHPDAIAIPVDQIARGEVVGAESRGTIVGFGAILARPDGDTDLDGLFVEPAYWGRGIGRTLVEACVGMARAKGSHGLHVIGNPHAEAFYTRCGFERTGVVATRFGPGLAMRRTV
ncbi:MAG: GNAT family N-acetyltransferase [Acidobacteriota bacterium]|nr:GNAT family N-acetyltransferase [Acidobacteriota bacterium]